MQVLVRILKNYYNTIINDYITIQEVYNAKLYDHKIQRILKKNIL